MYLYVYEARLHAHINISLYKSVNFSQKKKTNFKTKYKNETNLA